MKYYVGIDLGTTNSAICTYDGKNTRIWKSPEQNDVTPSAIFIDKRGNKYYGIRAYNQAPHNPNNSATLFKRYMGTSNIFKFQSAGISMTPEECSADILRTLYGYLPEEIRNSGECATVITVPAAFNQVKKDATQKAASLAGIGEVALMQEPVAAVMSVMKYSNQNGIFIVYDLGGGTFDISISENIKGKVTLRSHGGIEMCGGRDVDRTLFNNIVVPWLRDNFDLPEDFLFNEKYKSLLRIALWATEKAKIELSSTQETSIVLTEIDVGTLDESGEEIYLDVPLSRRDEDSALASVIQDTVRTTMDTIEKAGIAPIDVESIIFVGGPTQYKPLRDAVSDALGIKANIDVNPMTAVAEGASIYAESLNWEEKRHTIKPSKVISNSIDCLELKYNNRVSTSKTKLQLKINPRNQTGFKQIKFSIEITSKETGWTSGEFNIGYLEDNSGITSNRADDNNRVVVIDLPLSVDGDNTFSVNVYNAEAGSAPLGCKTIKITKAIATITSITASQSIGIEVLEKLGGKSTLDFIVKEDDPLPKTGIIIVRASKALRAGSNETINIKLWEGNILDPVEDNRYIGVLQIRGTDFDYGVIPAGAEIECSYDISDSGNLALNVAVPSIGATFEAHNFYSSSEGKVNLENVDAIADEAKDLQTRIDSLSEQISDKNLELAREKVERVSHIDCNKNDPEDVERAFNDLLEAKKLLNKVSQDNAKKIKQIEFNDLIKSAEELKPYFTKEEAEYETLKRKAEKSLGKDDEAFESAYKEITNLIVACLARQDWFNVDLFRELCRNPNNYTDSKAFTQLKNEGEFAIKSNDMDRLRGVIGGLLAIQKRSMSTADFLKANILKG